MSGFSATEAKLFLDAAFAFLRGELRDFDGVDDHGVGVMLHLTRVKANVDLKDKGEGFLKGVFKSKGCWGLPQQLLAMTGCLGSSRTKVYKQAHTRE